MLGRWLTGITAKKSAEPEMRMSMESCRASWWDLFTNFLGYVADDKESLLDAARNAPSVVAAARVLADAALDEYQDRWMR